MLAPPEKAAAYERGGGGRNGPLVPGKKSACGRTFVSGSGVLVALRVTTSDKPLIRAVVLNEAGKLLTNCVRRSSVDDPPTPIPGVTLAADRRPHSGARAMAHWGHCTDPRGLRHQRRGQQRFGDRYGDQRDHRHHTGRP